MLSVCYFMECVDNIGNMSNIVEAFSHRQRRDKFMNVAGVQHAEDILWAVFLVP